MGIELITKNGNITLTKPTGTGGGTVDLSNYYTKEQINAMLAEVDGDVDALFQKIEKEYATIELVEEKIAAIPSPDMSEYAKKTDIPDVSGFITEVPSEYVTDSELNAKGYLTEHQSLESYPTWGDLGSAISDKVTTEQLNEAIDEFVTETDMNIAIQNAISAIVDGEEVSY